MTRRLPARTTLVGALRDTADARGHKVAFRHGVLSLTFAELWRAAGRAADALAAVGVRPGHVVAVGCADPIERIVAHCGVLRAGACALPLGPGIRDELPPLLTTAEARALVADAPLVARALAAGGGLRCFCTEPDIDGAESWQDARAHAPHAGERAVMPDDAALLLFTSGTTGPPKGVLHTHARCMANLEALRRAWEWGAADVLYLPVALFHAHGLQNGVHGTLATGCTTVLPDGRASGDAMLQTLAAERCSLVFGVPTHYGRLVTAADGAPELARDAARAVRLFVSGSAPLPPETFRRFQERFGHAICERYGMTETLMIASNPLDGERRAGSVGFPLAGTAVRIADPESGATCLPGDPGEVWVRGVSVFDGYHARPGFPHPANAVAFHDGWFRTGDLGLWESDGRLRLLGRRDELILTGGVNVSPDEVEAALASHPDVAAAAVAGVPDDELGQCVAAAVVPVPGAEPSPHALAAHVATRLEGHKKPRRVRLLAALPLTAVGKLDRRALQSLLAEAPRVDGRPESAAAPPR